MNSDWKVPEAPHSRVPLNVADKSINYEAAAFTQHEKLLWISVDRINKFLDNKQWTDANLSKHRLYYEKCPPVSMQVYSPDPKTELRPLFNTVMEECKWTNCKVADSFGPSWSSHWFKLVLKPKASWPDNAEIHLLWNSNTEATLWSENGVCLQGFAGGTDQIREEFMFDAGTTFPLTVYIEMACNNRFGVGDDFLGPPPPNETFKVEKCSLGWFNRKAWDLMWDLRVIKDLIKKLDKDCQPRLQILRATNNILNNIDPLDENTYAKGRELAAKILYGNNVNDGHFIDVKTDDCTDFCGEHTVYAVGNCHIDTAWLWPYGETRRKVMRSWASQLQLMKLYNTKEHNLNYNFTASQAQQFQWLLEDCPELFKRIQEQSDNNKFHVVGGTWVEMDGNIPSGEGFVRQFLYGQEFYLKHFGRRCKIFWLPDTFGYSGQLPQIIRQSGIDYFLTQKLSWNLINRFPHHSFIWEGIDGSSVLTHFPPADTYVAQCNVGDVLSSRDNYKNKSCNRESLMLFGWGDGGGGPTTMHLERMKRYANNGGMRNIPKVKLSGPLEFFNKLAKSSNRFPRYVGELYFELHRGTYTTHALIKKGNRVSELLLQFVEFVYTILNINGICKYPSDNIDKLWKLVLLNQFHDVLPGSSIELANIDARKIYDQVSIELKKLITSGLTQFSEYLTAQSQTNDNYIESAACIVNNKSWRRRELLHILDGDSSILSEDDKKISQTTYDNQRLIMVECDSCSISPLNAIKSVDIVFIKKQDKGNIFIMENSCIYVEILSNGIINSLIHKLTNKQVIKKDANSDNIGGNNFLLFEDKPLFWEAWDVELYHLQKYESISDKNIKNNEMKIIIIENGPLRCGVEYRLMISDKSTLIQRIFIESENAAILFETDIDWKEKYKFLKVQFPLNIRSNVCNYDIQFGFLQRPTVMNNTEDIAKFEVVGHKFADLSEYDFGAALINDSKYGYSCFRNLLRLSLLRAPKKPDANTDIHKHFIKYCLLPHNQTLQTANVIQYSQNYNQSLTYIQTNQNRINKYQLNGFSFFQINTKQIILDTVKIAQGDNCNDVILRFYEAFGGRTECNVTIKINNIKKANICNLLEDISHEIKVKQIDKETSQIKLYFQPFEIKSVRLTL